jgi:hypothetical protein
MSASMRSFCGVGSGGTITGLTHFFRAKDKPVRMVLADPQGSVLAEYTRSGRIGAVGSWQVEGIGEDFVPPIADLSGVTEAYTIDDKESFAVARELFRVEGVFAGSSSGTLLAAALRYCRSRTAPERVVTFVCDAGAKYLSKMYDDAWMADNGLLERATVGDLTDLITRRFAEGAVVTTGADRHAAQRARPLQALQRVAAAGRRERTDRRARRRVRRAARRRPRPPALRCARLERDEHASRHGGAGRADCAPLRDLRARARAHSRRRRRFRRADHANRHPQLPAAETDMTDKPHKLGTLAIHAGQPPDPATGAVITPIYATSTYVQQSPGVHQGLDYGRSHNPTRWAYERCVAALESGTDAFAFASGMATTATVLELLDSGSHVVALDDLYGGTRRLFERVRKRSAGLSFTYLAVLAQRRSPARSATGDEDDLDRVAVEPAAEAGRPRGGRRVRKIAQHHFGDRQHVRVAVVPAAARARFDIVVHSATKYLNGHSM